MIYLEIFLIGFLNSNSGDDCDPVSDVRSMILSLHSHQNYYRKWVFVNTPSTEGFLNIATMSHCCPLYFIFSDCLLRSYKGQLRALGERIDSPSELCMSMCRLAVWCHCLGRHEQRIFISFAD